ncbi:MAG: hypothetical protein KGN36_15605 [Acidobacteriota bacterium]|nr:hypothetical protein [Acidobacteriota bacterium]
MRLAALAVALLSTVSLHGQTATYTASSQNVSLAGLGGSGGTGQSRVTWGTCAYDGSNTQCTITAPYTGVGGGGTISIVLAYPGNGTSPFLANSISPDSDLVTFGLTPGSSGSITVSLTENTGATVKFLSNNFTFYYDLSAACTGTAVSSCGIGQVGLTPGAVISGRVHGTFDATPVIRSVISASAYGAFASLAPATWMEIYGSNLANVTSRIWTGADFNGNQAPSALEGTTVTIGGKPAFLDYVSLTQVNAQVPSDVPTGPQPVVVTTPGGTSKAFTINVNQTEPGLLAPNALYLSAGQYVAALFPDGVTFVLPPNAVGGVPAARAKPGQTIIFYGVGFGPVTPNSPAGVIVSQANVLNANLQISFAGIPATVSFSGLTGGYLGLYQFNVVVPNVAPSDTVPVTFSLGGAAGNQKLIIPISN